MKESALNQKDIGARVPSPQSAKRPYYTWDPKVAVIRKELVVLTGDADIAVVLNQLLYWSQRVKDYDLLIEEEKSLFYKAVLGGEEENQDGRLSLSSSAQYGWLYKSAPELSEETLLGVSRVTMRRYLNVLLERGWIQERRNPKYKYDKTTHYRVNLYQLDKDLRAIGYGLPGFVLRGDSIEKIPQKTSMLKSEPSNVQNLPFEGKESEHTDVGSSSSLSQVDENPQKTSMLKIEPSNVQNLPFEGKESEHTDVGSSPSLSQTGENPQKTSMLKIEPSNVQNLPFDSKESEHTDVGSSSSLSQTGENPQKSSMLKIEPSNVQKSTFECKESEHSNVQKCTFITENKTENINREKHRADARTGAYTREAEVDDASDREQELTSPSAKVAALMVDLWRRHVNPEAISLTDERKRRLESLLQLHFQADLRVWESFCLRVKTAPFLMGGGNRKWHVTLDWVLAKGNLLKVLEGNYDDSGRMEHQKNEPFKGVQDREIRALLDSIQDSFWKNWCSQLMGIHPITGGPLMDGDKHIEAVLTVYELKQITEARFMEFDGRLVWIECFDEKTLSKIEDLRFKISPVARATFPEARAVRGHLHQPPFIQ